MSSAPPPPPADSTTEVESGEPFDPLKWKALRSKERFGKNDTRFSTKAEHRGHVLEAGDKICPPCGAKNTISTHSIGHYSSCEECVGHSVVLDTLKIAFDTKAQLGQDVCAIPPWSYTGLKKLAAKLEPEGVVENLSTFAKQDKGWNPEMPVKYHDKGEGVIRLTTNNLWEVWSAIPQVERGQYLRAPTHSPTGFKLTSDNAGAVAANEHQVKLEYDCLMTLVQYAAADERITQQYVDTVLENIGVVRTTHPNYSQFSKAAGCQVYKVRNTILGAVAKGRATTEQQESTLVPPTSPRKRTMGESFQVTHGRNTRRNLFGGGTGTGGMGGTGTSGDGTGGGGTGGGGTGGIGTGGGPTGGVPTGGVGTSGDGAGGSA